MQGEPVSSASDPIGAGLAPELRYGDQSAMGLPSVKTLRTFQAMNQATFGPGNKVVRIRVASQEFLALEEALLEFDFSNDSAASTDVVLDGGAGGCINMMRILSLQGVELERLEGYNLINAIELQYMSTDEELRESGGFCGCASVTDDSLHFPLETDTSVAETSAKVRLSGYRPSRADRLGSAVVRHYAIKLRGGWFNTDLKKLLPPDVHFEIELTLADANEFMVVPKYARVNAITGTTHANEDFSTEFAHGLADNDHVMFTLGDKSTADLGTTTIVEGKKYQIFDSATTSQFSLEDVGGSTQLTFTADPGAAAATPGGMIYMGSGPAVDYSITNVELKVPAVRILSSRFLQKMAMMRESGYVWTAPTYKRYINTVTNTTGTETFQIADRSNSLDAMIHVLRQNRNVLNSSRYGLSNRSIQYVTDFQMQIGTELFPPQKIDVVAPSSGATKLCNPLLNDSNTSVNISEAWAEAKRVFGFGRGIITPENFGQIEENDGCGVLCVSTKSYEENSRLLSGINTKQGALPITLTITKKQGFPGAHSANTTFGEGQTGLLVSFAKCAAMFSIAPQTGLLDSST